MAETNMALLSQSEIDTLVKFINQKRSSIGADVLEQSSIDKMIRLLERNALIEFAKDKNCVAIMENVMIEDSEMKVGYGDNGFIKIIVAAKNGQNVLITPKCVEKSAIVNDDSNWGMAISPLFFDQIATIFGTKYSQDTYKWVCRRYAEIIYGDKEYELADIYLPSGISIVDNIINEK